MNHLAFGCRRLVAHVLAGFAVLMLGSCSGNVGSDTPDSTGSPTAIVISPATATLFSGLPTEFVVTGGNGNYIVSSSNQAVVPLSGTFTGNIFTIVPNTVAEDTPVTLTVRDSGTAAAATATLTVRPRTINNVVTITPSASQAAACGTAICAGGDAEVRVTLAQNGIPLVGRTVRFDVVSGDVRIITSAAGAPELLGTTGTTVTDDTGTARMRVRVLADATSQTALLQVTDVSSGFTQRTSVTIAPTSNAPLNAQPATIAFQGTTPQTCASGISADVIVFGGRPPYLISQPGSFTVTPTLVTQSGGRFTVTANGQCSAGSQIAVVDQLGATVNVTASNILSSVPAPTPPTVPDFSVSPTEVTLNSCSDVANVVVVGGTGSYVVQSGNDAVDARMAGTNQGRIQRRSGSGATTSPVRVAFSDGRTVREVTVQLTPGTSGALGPC